MQVFLDGKALNIELPHAATYGTAIEQIENYMNGQNKILSVISLNDKEISPEEEKNMVDVQLADDSRFDIEAVDGEEVLVSAITVAIDDLPQLTSSMRQVALSLQTGLKQEAFALFQDCLETWRQLINLLQVVQNMLPFEIEKVVVGGRSVREINEHLVKVLLETKTAMESDDLVTISDMLEYELCTMADDEKQVLEQLIELVRNQARPDAV